jgi:ABC-2 type transport system permease protein
MAATPLLLTQVLLKIFLRDRQAIFFMVFFPIIFMLALGYGSNSSPGPVTLGIADNSQGEMAQSLIASLERNPSFSVVLGSQEELKKAQLNGELPAILVLPSEFTASDVNVPATLLIDSSQLREVSQVLPLLQQAFVGIEREIRDAQPLIALTVDDIQPRMLRYIDFLLPGILAFTLMQISIAGSGFNIVEYRRKGILKRLFVTPIMPKDFIIGIVLARLLLCLFQISFLILIARVFMQVEIAGNYLSLYSVILLGTVIFLCIGFALGSLAKTQQGIQALGNLVIFPQIFLSGIFFPIDSLPEFLQPIASLLPLSFVATALRDIATNGLSLLEIIPSLAGIAIWTGIGFIIATRYFVWKEVAN